MIIKEEIKQKFIEFHVKFVHSPLDIYLSGGQTTAVCLPIDVNSIINQLREETRTQIKLRVMGKKLEVMCISRKEGHVLLEAITKRFETSKSNLLDSIKKLETLTTSNQVNRLSEDFHGYYRPAIKSFNRNNIENAITAIGRC
jgi:hypothetical protein